ncbi:MAG: hypothetical protein AAFW98_18465 [Pseudomonadota bacterium]
MTAANLATLDHVGVQLGAPNPHALLEAAAAVVTGAHINVEAVEVMLMATSTAMDLLNTGIVDFDMRDGRRSKRRGLGSAGRGQRPKTNGERGAKSNCILFNAHWYLLDLCFTCQRTIRWLPEDGDDLFVAA